MSPIFVPPREEQPVSEQEHGDRVITDGLVITAEAVVIHADGTTD
jgi:hypothetical protein